MSSLIVCCDGTWNTLNNEDDGVLAPTNVFKLFNAVDLSVGKPQQLTRYQSGVGTEGGAVERLRGGFTGTGLGEDICDCYHWLARKYQPGDKLFLFGFSRGAFASRSLAGMICKFGIVKLAAQDDYYSVIKRVYHQGYRNGQDLSGIQFHSNSNRVHFVGVWDTVGALGIPDDKVLLDLLDDPSRYQFHDTTLSKRIEYARHAVAIDEKRGSFTPTLWNTANIRDAQHLKQIWFPGAHSDVGGGYKEHGLSDGALWWMIQESQAAGVVYRDDSVSQIHPNACDVLHDSHTGMMKALVTAPRSIPSLARGEYFHDSVAKRRNNPPIEQLSYLPERQFENRQVKFDVYAKQTWNWTGVYLKAGTKYHFRAEGQWTAGTMSYGPDGSDDVGFTMRIGSLLGKLEALHKEITGREGADFIGSKRFEHAAWFQLVGAVADGGNPGRDGTHDRLTTFVIGDGCNLIPKKSGYLYCFANDAWGFYGDSRGFVTVILKKED